METALGMGTGKGVAREDGGGGGGGGLDLGFGFGFGFASDHHHPQKMIRTDTFPFRAVMNNAATAFSAGNVAPFSSSSPPNKGNGNGSCGGPTSFYNSDIICDLNGDGSRGLLPFAAAFKSPGMAGAGTLRYSSPFTSAQWQELQRQALIYKHFMASTPVPPELLFRYRDLQSPPTFISHLDRGAGYFNLRFSNGSDPEPGRCRRTDGKKWRCSRDVAPDQKYCERHLHRGRPRSRKPVEHRKANAVAAHDTTPSTASAITGSATAATLSNLSPKPCSLSSDGLLSKPGIKLPLQSMATDKEPRYLDWMKGDSEEMVASQQWQLMHSRVGLRSAAPVLQHYDAQSQFNCSGLNYPCCSFLSTDLSALEDDSVANQIEPPRRFIDAWSTENLMTNNENSNRNISSVSSGGRLPPSTLTLSMAGGGDDTDQIEMGLGLSDSVKSQPLSWMTPASPLGGPLAEVLQSRNVASPSHGYNSGGGGKSSCSALNLMSKSCCGSNGASPRNSPNGLASSPTGVLQRNLVSNSDSSSSSSPRFGVSSGSEVAVQWINQTK